MRNILKITLVVALAVGLTVAFAPKAQAFHDDGVAHCNGCHTMHNSYQGAEVLAGGTVAYLLKGATVSDTCLNCHSGTRGYRVLSNDVLTPKADGRGAGGGDFVFLNEDNINDGHGSAILGERAGHNINTSRVNPETTLTEAPGGGASPYQTADLDCASCHEPHGGPQFRFLHYSGSKTPPSQFASTAEFIADETGVSSNAGDDNHTAYKQNTANWCASCHTEMHSGTASGLVHPTGETLGTNKAAAYNTYFGTDQPDSGGDPFIELVPVEWNDATYTTSYKGDIAASSKVTCFTCHRAHATQNPSIGRWDFNMTIWEEEGASGSYATPNPYPAAGIHQRSLCNKCHVKDEGDL